eukprot:8878169-Karenia_brevis.AAC.1
MVLVVMMMMMMMVMMIMMMMMILTGPPRQTLRDLAYTVGKKQQKRDPKELIISSPQAGVF